MARAFAVWPGYSPGASALAGRRYFCQALGDLPTLFWQSRVKRVRSQLFRTVQIARCLSHD